MRRLAQAFAGSNSHLRRRFRSEASWLRVGAADPGCSVSNIPASAKVSEEEAQHDRKYHPQNVSDLDGPFDRASATSKPEFRVQGFGGSGFRVF